MQPSALVLAGGLRSFLIGLLVLIIFASIAFAKRQNKGSAIGGGISKAKSIWLGWTIYHWLFLSLSLALFAPLGGPLQTIYVVFTGLFWTRALAELYLMYGPKAWKTSYGIGHNLLCLVWIVFALYYYREPLSLQNTPLQTWSKLLLQVFAVTLLLETYYARAFHRAIDGQTTGDQGVWFAAAKDPRFRKINLLTTAANIPLLLFSGVFFYAVILSPPQTNAQGQKTAQQLQIPHLAVIAHRGASYYAPEETRPAYELALKMGADYLELDLQRTKDGVLIALHDDTLERTTNIKEVFPKRIKETVEKFTWQELQQLDAGSWFNQTHPARARKNYVGTKILKIDTVLDIAESIPQSPGIYIETKAASRFPGIEHQLVLLLRRRGWINSPGAPVQKKGKIIFQSFEPNSLTTLAKLAPEVPRVYLVEHDISFEQWSEEIDIALKHQAHLGPSGYQGFLKYTQPAHQKDRLIHHYTINQLWQMMLLHRFGSDGFFTDRPDLALRFLGRKGPPPTKIVD